MVLPCDGIGPEIMAATIAVLEAADACFGLGIEFVPETAGLDSLATHGITLRDEVLERAKVCDGILLGPQSHMDYPALERGGRNVSASFRVELDLYANIRPARSRQSLINKAPGMDLVIMREATEGFYPDRNMHRGTAEVMPDPDMALSIRKITRAASTRICREAFHLARRRKKLVTAVHKANSFLLTDGLFLDCFEAVAADFRDVHSECLLVDAMAAHLVRHPERFDVVVATNFYGDILSDLASELSGSLGLAGAINANRETGRVCAQAQHGSAPDIAGNDSANPTSLILSGAMLLKWLGEHREDELMTRAGLSIEKAVDTVLTASANRTRDLGGATGTTAFGRLVSMEIRNV